MDRRIGHALARPSKMEVRASRATTPPRGCGSAGWRARTLRRLPTRSTEGSSTGLSAWCARTRARASIASGCWASFTNRDAGRRRKPGGDAGKSSGGDGGVPPCSTLPHCRMPQPRSLRHVPPRAALGRNVSKPATCWCSWCRCRSSARYQRYCARGHETVRYRRLLATACALRSLKDSPILYIPESVGTERGSRTHVARSSSHRHQIELFVMKLRIGPNRDVRPSDCFVILNTARSSSRNARDVGIHGGRASVRRDPRRSSSPRTESRSRSSSST